MFSHCLYFNSTALARLLDREWSRAFARFDLTPAQAFMLRAILAQPGRLQRELAALLVIARPTATRTLDGLCHKGLVERRATTQDRREQALFPTPAATALASDLNAAAAAVTTRLKQQFGEEMFHETVRHIRLIRDGLE